VHPTRHIKHREHEADIDEDIADLVLAMWRAGIETVYSCQDRDGEAWIQLSRIMLAKWAPDPALVRSEYHGPAGRGMDKAHSHAYFQLKDKPKLIKGLPS
jgi:hypothetical protein